MIKYLVMTKGTAMAMVIRKEMDVVMLDTVVTSGTTLEPEVLATLMGTVMVVGTMKAMAMGWTAAEVRVQLP